MAATIASMAKRTKPETEPVRIHSDLARLANIIAADRNVSVPDLLSEILRPILEKERAKVAKRLLNEGSHPAAPAD